MVSVAIVLAWILASCLTGIAAYLALITFGSWFYKTNASKGRRNTRFAIVIPAHNEGAGIVVTLADIGACEYPQQLRDIFVIADNCTDDTADIARSCGATVYERSDLSNRGKGQALDWFLTSHQDLLAAYAVIVFVDADMHVNGQFLSALDDVFASGNAMVAQGKYLASNPSASWIAAFGFLGFAVANHVRPAGRNFLGSSAGLKGSGMAFQSALLLRMGWPCKSLAEDLELGKELAMQGVRVLYVPKAFVSSELGTSAGQAYVQQERWEGGRAAVTLKYLRLICARWRTAPSWPLMEEALDLLVPPLSVLATLTALAAVLSWLLGSAALWAVLLSGAVFVALVATGIIQSRMPWRAIGYLLGLPLFVALKLALLAKTVITGAGDWRRTPRSKETPDPGAEL